MYIMYVDESGDTGLVNSPSRYFVLSGVVIHELRWAPTLQKIIDFRRRMRNKYGLKLREEIHASHLLKNQKELARIKRQDRLSIIRNFTEEIAG